MYVFPFELGVFACEVMKWSCDMAIMFNEFAKITCETKVALCFFEIFEWCFPISNGFEFGFVNCNGAVGDDMSQIFDAACCEITFLEFAIPFGSCEAFEDLVHMFFVLLQ